MSKRKPAPLTPRPAPGGWLKEALRRVAGPRKPRQYPSPARPGQPREVVVKVARFYSGKRGLAALVSYLTRGGRLGLKGPMGEKLETREQVQEMVSAMTIAGQKSGRHAMQIVLSMPPGSPHEAVALAAEAWARETLAGHQYALVHHDDSRKGQLHTHIVVGLRGRDGRNLSHDRDDLRRWRERFAEQLLAVDVPAQASPARWRSRVREQHLVQAPTP
jgi:hypothetical protein